MNWRAGRDGTRPPDARAPAEYVHAQRAVRMPNNARVPSVRLRQLESGLLLNLSRGAG